MWQIVQTYFPFVLLLVLSIFYGMELLKLTTFLYFYRKGLLLLLLSRFSCVRLCATPQTAAYQALPSLGFSRQEHWSGLPLSFPLCESEVAQSCPTRSDPMDCSLPVSSIHGIFQARVLEWLAIAFSDGIKQLTH